MHYILNSFSPLFKYLSNRLNPTGAEEINNTDFFSQLPDEIILRTFSLLNAIPQAKCGEVSRRWRRLASDETLLAAFNPRNLSPLLKVFDESDWVTHVDLSAYGLTMGDIPPCDARKEITFLESVLSSRLMKKIALNAGITYLTIPKGLTLNKVIKLVGSSKVENTPFSNEIGDIPVDKTYRIVITNNAFEETQKLSFEDQITYLSEIGWEMPTLLEATVLLVVRFVSSQEHPPFGLSWTDTSWSCTRCIRCSKQLDGYPTTCASFSSSHISIGLIGGDFNFSSIGVRGVLRKF